MGARGTRSTASLTVASLDVAARRLRQPEGLPPPCVALWDAIVASLPADRFHKSDAPLLALYCRAVYQAEQAFASLEQHRATNGSELNPWLKVGDIAVKQVATLSARLRLCPQSRLDMKKAGVRARLD